MTHEDSMALQPAWVGIWLNFLLAGAFVAPLLLLIWKFSCKAGIVTLLSSVIAAFCVQYMFDAMGYVNLLGLPHLVFWIPTVVFLIAQQSRGDMTIWPLCWPLCWP